MSDKFAVWCFLIAAIGLASAIAGAIAYGVGWASESTIEVWLPISFGTIFTMLIVIMFGILIGKLRELYKKDKT